jgi:CRP-like cAMP-binding protein
MNEQRAQSYEKGNAFLDGLPPTERLALAEELRVVEIDAREAIFTRGGAIVDVYFPIDALFSITAELRRDYTADVYEVGVVGREGVVGLEAALGSPSSRRFVLTQVGGRAAVLPSSVLARRASASAALLGALHAYVLRRIYAAEQLVGCAFAHNLTQRAARWVLTVADKVGRPEFTLSREFLAMMLAIEPSAVRAATAALQAAGALRYDPDETLIILRPQTLYEAVCECYEALHEHGDVLADGRA